MARKLKNLNELKVGHIFGFCENYNQFKLIAKYKNYIWVEWQGDDPEV